MEQDRVQQIVGDQVAQWAEFAAASAQGWSARKPMVAVGGYWPLGADRPAVTPGLSQVRVTAVSAVGLAVNLEVSSPGDEEPVSVLVDLFEVPDDEPDDMVHTLIFARVAELVGSPAWADRPKGPSSTTVRL